MNQLQHHTSQEQMIQEQLIGRGITDQRVIEAFRIVHRERFMSPDWKAQACADRPAPIGYGQTISQPYIVALMTERLEIKPEHRVLEIGTGSGYQTAILSILAGEVYTVERLKPLLDEAFERLMEMGRKNIHFRFGDGSLGWTDKAPFDRILVTAGAPELPEHMLLDQLTENGIAVLPVGPADEQMLVAVRKSEGRLHKTDISPCRFVKLIGENAWEAEET
jgi:protein-L-isoaspartate(D-aspartate) O-methyltransferase